MYTNETYKNPFWAENSGFMTGRDPLGVQNSSITTYGRLLPGMTNLTLRLRYYGFYMWLLNEYENQKIPLVDRTLKSQYQFIRRAELIVAFVMRKTYPDEKSIIGSDFTEKKEIDFDTNEYFSIELGADKKENTVKGSVYWDYPSGALGQYYAGSLVALKLIAIEGKFYVIQEEGKKLAKAFSDSIPKVQQKKFLEIIGSGILSLKDINGLTDFCINKITLDSNEWSYYKNMLLGNDGLAFVDENNKPTSIRKETIGLYLRYIAKKDKQDFVTNQYNLNLKSKHNEASFGWYYYYINEAFHITLETIFWSILVQLDGKERIIEKFIDEITEKVVVGSIPHFVISSKQKVTEILDTIQNVNLVTELQILENEVKTPSNCEPAIIKAFKLMFTIYALTNTRNFEIIEFEKKYRVWGQKGRVSENLMLFIEQSKDNSYHAFVKDSIKKIINDHINTAYRKMGNGESNLLKFIIEDGIISHIQTMIPRHTSPRLKTIDNFMRDLSFVDIDSNLTKRGEELKIEI